MRKVFFFRLFILQVIYYSIALTSSHCIAQQLRWIHKIGGLTADTGVAVHLDSQENILDLTNFQGTVSVNNEIVMSSSGGTDIILRKSTSLGAILWARKIGGKGMDSGYDVASDVFGNVYVTGTFQDSLFYGSQFVMAVQNKTAGFVLRINEEGQLVSSFILESTQNVVPKNISVVSGNQLLISGNFDGEMDADPGSQEFLMNAMNGTDVFIARYTFGGVLVWANNFGNSEAVNINNHYLDEQGNIFITGDFRGILNLITSQSNQTLSSSGLTDIFVARLNGQGQILWARNFGGPGLDNGYAITRDASGNIIVTGRYSNTVVFQQGVSGGTVTSKGSGDAFVLKLDSDGTFIWITSVGGFSNDVGRAVTTNVRGIIYVGGTFRDSVVFNNFNAESTTQLSQGGDDAFCLILNHDGTYNDHFVVGGFANEQLNDIVLKANGELISVGAYGAIVDFDPSPAVINILSTGGLDAFMLNVFVCVNPYLKDLRVLTPEICSGDRGIVQIAEGYLNGATQWSWQRNNCNSITFASGDFIDLRLTQSITYFIKGTGGCITEEICHRADIRVFTDTLSFTFVNLCEGDSLMVGQNVYTTPGVYIDSLQTAFGCDSVIVSEVMVFPRYEFISFDTICHGDSVLIGSTYYTNPGVYTTQLQTSMGCDSIITANITVIPAVITTSDVTICEGDIHFIGDQPYTESGTYTLTMISERGCEDYLITNLTVIPKTYSSTVSLCAGDSIVVGGNVYRDNGIYTDTLTSITGCDSIVTTTVLVYPVYSVQQQISICEGDSISVGTQYYSVEGIFTDTLQSINGCDSIVQTQLTVFQVPPIYEIFVDICKGDSWQVGGNVYTQSGMYLDTLQTSNGCDSLIITHLNVLETFFEQQITICRGDSIFVGDSIYKNPGSYINIFNGSYGCDSILTTYLRLIDPVSTMLQFTICPGDSVQVGDSLYVFPGNYTNTLVSGSNGCDSIVNTSIQWYNTEFYQEITICNGQSITVGTNVYNAPGIYTDSLIALTGCDSIITTKLDVSKPSSSIEAKICEGQRFTIGNNHFETTGTYYITLTALNGCDSVITLNLFVLPTIRTEGFFEICRGDSIQLGGIFYYDNAIHTDTVISSLGCDSISRIAVNIIDIDTTLNVDGNTLSVFAQDGIQYRWYSCAKPDSTLSQFNQPIFIVTESGEYAAEIIFRGCRFNTRCVRIEITGTENIINESIRLFPNPAMDYMHLHLSAESKVDIIATDGKMMSSHNFMSGDQILDISDLQSGTYILRVMSDRSQKSFIFVKM